MDVNSDVDLTTYFKEHLALTEYNSFFMRVTNALVRGGITTMDAMCELPDEKLKRVRNLGVKSFEAVVLMREMYPKFPAKIFTYTKPKHV